MQMAHSPFLSNCGNTLHCSVCLCVCVSLKQFSGTHRSVLQIGNGGAERLSGSNQRHGLFC